MMLVLIALTLLLTIGVFYYLNRPLRFSEPSVTYLLKPGTSATRLAYELRNKGYIQYPRLFALLIRLEGQGDKLKVGDYEFEPGISVQKIINKLATGDVQKHQITLIDGTTFQQVLDELAENPYIQHKLLGQSIAEIAQRLGIEQSNPEGWFLPETYQFQWPDSDLDILKRAHKAMQVVLNAEWQQRTTGLVYKTPYQALIVASMIEKESADRTELNKISGVIFRRIQKGMRLQIDPTVIYALGERYNGKITKKNLRYRSPYNTYRVKGLPPTPISLPSAAAIHAALQPDDGHELYFVAKGDGSHHFSSTLKAHDRAVIKYLLNNKR